jgi:ABC-type nickel/cobalt efflux system permease component RcnA
VSDPEVVSAQRASKAARDIANGMVACVLATAIAWVLRQSKTKMLRVELARRMEVLESVAAACLVQSILLATQQLASIGDVDNDDDGDADDDGDDDGHGHDDHDQDEADDTDHEHDDVNDDDDDDNDDDRDCDASEDQGAASRTARKSAVVNRLREELDGMYASLEGDHAPVVTSSAI